MSKDPTYNDLNQKVTEAIFRAEHFFEGSAKAIETFKEVSLLEEAIAKITNPNELDGYVSRRGAVTAAISARDYDRARDLVEVFVKEPCSEPLRLALEALREEVTLAKS